jgi:hypothetical protein
MKKAIVILLFLLQLSSCAVTRQSVPIPSPMSASGDKVRIYVIRTSILGCLLPVEISDNNRQIGELEKGRYLCWERESGELVIKSTTKTHDLFGSKVVDTLKLMTENGQTYYVHLKPSMGFIMILPHNRPVLVSSEAAHQMLKRCRPATI